MKLDAFVLTGQGQLGMASLALSRSTGEVLTCPVPLYRLDDDMALLPATRLADDTTITLALDDWTVYDLRHGRDTGLTVTGQPHTDTVARLAHQYVTEARHLPQHELRAWVNTTVARYQHAS